MTLNELILKLPPGWRIELVNDNNQLGAFTGNAPEGIHVFRFTLTDTQLRSTEHSITPGKSVV